MYVNLLNSCRNVKRVLLWLHRNSMLWILPLRHRSQFLPRILSLIPPMNLMAICQCTFQALTINNLISIQVHPTHYLSATTLTLHFTLVCHCHLCTPHLKCHLIILRSKKLVLLIIHKRHPRPSPPPACSSRLRRIPHPRQLLLHLKDACKTSAIFGRCQCYHWVPKLTLLMSWVNQMF